MALKYDWDIIIPALEKAQNVLYHAKGDCRNTKAMDFLDDCIDSMNTWIENAKPREEEPVINSRKSIQSGFAKRNAQMIMEKLGQCDGIVKTCISICPDSRLEKELDGLQKNIVDVASKAEMLSNGDEDIQSSCKSIKSSLDERLVPYLEEFEEGYSNALADDPMDSYAGFDTTNARCETFYERFKSDHNLTDDDINNLETAVLDMWHETDDDINNFMWHETDAEID